MQLSVHLNGNQIDFISYFSIIFILIRIFRRFQTMKYWISHLPLEVWVDVFSFPLMSREEMGRIVDKIGNFKFAEYLQFYLHDWGKQKLDRFKFDQVNLFDKINLNESQNSGWPTQTSLSFTIFSPLGHSTDASADEYQIFQSHFNWVCLFSI